MSDEKPLDEEPPKKRRRSARAIGAGVVVAVLVVTGAIGWALHAYGPHFGIWFPPPSARDYGRTALGLLDDGLYADTPQWVAARADAATRIDAATTHDEVDAVLGDAIGVAGGKHSFLVDADADEQGADSYEAPTWSMSGCVLTVALPGYMGTPEQGSSYANSIADALSQDDLCGVVVDLRDNDGGDMGPMIAGLSPLLPDGVVATFTIGDRRTPVALSDGRVSGGGTPTSVGQRAKLVVPVAVLISERTASSGEQALLAFRGMANVRTFGQPTAGYASVNTAIPLYTGRTMVLTVGTTTARTGEEFGDEPIAPDEIREADEAPAAAQEWIANNQ